MCVGATSMCLKFLLALLKLCQNGQCQKGGKLHRAEAKCVQYSLSCSLGIRIYSDLVIFSDTCVFGNRGKY